MAQCNWNSEIDSVFQQTFIYKVTCKHFHLEISLRKHVLNVLLHIQTRSLLSALGWQVFGMWILVNLGDTPAKSKELEERAPQCLPLHSQGFQRKLGICGNQFSSSIFLGAFLGTLMPVFEQWGWKWFVWTFNIQVLHNCSQFSIGFCWCQFDHGVVSVRFSFSYVTVILNF